MGFTAEDFDLVIEDMVGLGKATYCMGDDIRWWCWSRPHLLYDYFKQRFAQVTNPPIDPREKRDEPGDASGRTASGPAAPG